MTVPKPAPTASKYYDEHIENILYSQYFGFENYVYCKGGLRNLRRKGAVLCLALGVRKRLARADESGLLRNEPVRSNEISSNL